MKNFTNQILSNLCLFSLILLTLNACNGGNSTNNEKPAEMVNQDGNG